MNSNCVSAEKQFGIVVFVMCEVVLQSKSAQIVAPNVYWETPLNHNSYTPSPPPLPSKTPDLHQSQERPLAKLDGHVHHVHPTFARGRS